MSDDQEVEKSYELPEFVAELRSLADALESGGEFTMEIEGETVTVPAAATVVSVKYEQEDGVAAMEFQLSWEVEDDEEVADETDKEEHEDA
jgi:amphi-Trp domain-containing protein